MRMLRRAESPSGDAGAGEKPAALPGAQSAESAPAGSGGVADPSKSAGSAAGSEAGSKGADRALPGPKQPETAAEWAAHAAAQQAEIDKLNERIKHKDKSYAAKLKNERENAFREESAEADENANRDIYDSEGKVKPGKLADATAERTEEQIARKEREREANSDVAEFAERHGLSEADYRKKVMEPLVALHEGTLGIAGQTEFAKAVIRGLTADAFVEQSNKFHYELGYAKAMEKVRAITPEAIGGGGGPVAPKLDPSAYPENSWERLMVEKAR